MSDKEKRVIPTCPYCGEREQIQVDALAHWDFKKQDWVISGTLDTGSCGACDDSDIKSFNWLEVEDA